jgi:thiaminase/transcriptional activator TenA
VFFNQLRHRVADLIPKIYALPFNQKLANGTLAREKFTFYLAQDTFYLADFVKALALTAARLPYDHQTELFIQFAMDTITERKLHLECLNKQAISMPLKSEQSPFCFIYSNYLLKMAHHAPVEEAVASLLPCFWIYQQVGQHMLAQKTLNNPYQGWIDRYTSPEFNTSVDLAINTVNELAEVASAHTKKNMLAAFKLATQLEYGFWQGAYTQEEAYLSSHHLIACRYLTRKTKVKCNHRHNQIEKTIG